METFNNATEEMVGIPTLVSCAFVSNASVQIHFYRVAL